MRIHAYSAHTCQCRVHKANLGSDTVQYNLKFINRTNLHKIERKNGFFFDSSFLYTFFPCPNWSC